MVRALLVLLAAVTVILADRADAATVVGGGSSSTDCFVTFDVGTASASTVGRRTTIECVECDPFCDADIAGQDGRCVLPVTICTGQVATQGCDPGTPLAPVKVVGATPVGVDTPACRLYYADAALRRGGKRAGVRKVKLRAVSAGRPSRVDADVIRYRCLPREGECPAPPVTTTTFVLGPAPCASSVACRGPCSRSGETCRSQGGTCRCVAVGF